MSKKQFGYIGAAPTQSFANLPSSNTGVFNIDDINFLKDKQQYPFFGQLELIQTQTVTSTTSAVGFSNLGDYNVHFIAQSNVDLSTDGAFSLVQLSSNGGTSYITTGYQYARQRNYISSGSAYSQQGKSDNTSYVAQLGSSGTSSNEKGNSYAYLYNLLDSNKYSYATFQAISKSSTDLDSYYGGGVLPTAATHNAIRITASSGNIEGMNISLYGIRFT